MRLAGLTDHALRPSDGLRRWLITKAGREQSPRSLALLSPMIAGPTPSSASDSLRSSRVGRPPQSPTGGILSAADEHRPGKAVAPTAFDQRYA